MSKTIYYFGAGASFGRKDSRELISVGTEKAYLKITEGLPVVSEIPQCLLSFKNAVISAEIDNQKDYTFLNMMRVQGSDINRMRRDLLMAIDNLVLAASQHATIDTYAKKLTLIRDFVQLKTIKNVLCAFFVWIQLTSKLDQRYDTFLANILQMYNLYIPKDISILSWNYDSQFEIAYRYYSKNGRLPIYDKNITKDFSKLSENGRIFKLNGSANFGDFTAVNFINDDTNLEPILQVILYYGNLVADTSSLGYQFASKLSFAWEPSSQDENMMNAINSTTVDTETVVIIGYSFPFCNREIDRRIFASMQNLKTIYIQDPNPESVGQSLRAVVPDYFKGEILQETDCTQFLMPKEL
ncbi:MAG: hypothetical protein KBT27_02695 [Prevotellaceae bacterium]|nr:hypothetical protein [Candidatus Faecinaster equi]